MEHRQQPYQQKIENIMNENAEILSKARVRLGNYVLEIDENMCELLYKFKEFSDITLDGIEDIMNMLIESTDEGIEIDAEDAMQSLRTLKRLKKDLWDLSEIDLKKFESNGRKEANDR